MFLILLACTGEKDAPADSMSGDSADSAPLPDSDAVDADGDGYVAADDCDDLDSTINPGAVETCDGVDEDCDGTIDEDAGTDWYLDADGDGYAGGSPVPSCDPPAGGAADSTDCDDTDPSTWPGAPEVCGDRADLNCDGYHVACDLEDSDVTVLGDTKYTSLVPDEGATLDGDLDGDGLADLVLSSLYFPRDGNDYTVSIVLGSTLATGGSFALTADALLTESDRECGDEHTQTWFGWHVIYAPDVDHGGGDDLVINVEACGASQDAGFWFVKGEDISRDGSLSLGDATFFAGTDGSLDRSGAGDLDGDGFTDVAFAGITASLYVFGGSEQETWGRDLPIDSADSTVTFDSPDTDLTTIPARFGDLDGDGIDDLVARPWDPMSVSIFLGGLPLGSLTSADATATIAACHTFTEIGISELDGDGRADLVVGLLDDDLESNIIFRGAQISSGATLACESPDVTLTPPAATDLTRTRPQGDLDGDGRDELAVRADPGAHPDVTEATTWLIYGADLVDGTLDPTVIGTPFVGEPGRQVLPGRGGDTNGDGLSDLLLLKSGTYGTDEVYDDTYHVVFGR